MDFIKKNRISILAVVVLITGLTASNFLKPQLSSKHSALCDISENTCKLIINNQSLHVRFVNHPQVEERLELHITSDSLLKIENANIKGVNLYMGTIPVVAENINQKDWLGWTYLGACAEPNMTWELEVSVNTEQGIKKGHLKFETSLH